jgi:hypothetical protein
VAGEVVRAALAAAAAASWATAKHPRFTDVVDSAWEAAAEEAAADALGVAAGGPAGAAGWSLAWEAARTAAGVAAREGMERMASDAAQAAARRVLAPTAATVRQSGMDLFVRMFTQS